MLRARSGASCVPPALETWAPSRSLGGIGNGPWTGPSGRYLLRTGGAFAGFCASAAFVTVRLAALAVGAGFADFDFAVVDFAVFAAGADLGVAGFLSRELVAPSAERAPAARAVEVCVFRFLEREVEDAAAGTLCFERVAPADDAEGVFRFVRPEPAADRASFRDMILAHGRAFR